PQLASDLIGHVVIAHLVGNIVVYAGAAQVGTDEHPGEDGAQNTADAMHAEHIEAVVITELALEPGHRPQAHEAGEDADDNSAHRADKAASRRDCHQTCYCA